MQLLPETFIHYHRRHNAELQRAATRFRTLRRLAHAEKAARAGAQS